MRPLAVIALAFAASCDRSPARPAGAGAGSSAGSIGAGSGAVAEQREAMGGGDPAGAAGGAGGNATRGNDPWAAPPAPVPETPESRQRRADAALGRVAKIEPEVARLRHLAFERAVPTRYQKSDEFRAFVHREIARELPAARSRDLTAALAHLGFLAKPTDLAGVEEQAMTTQAGAYYDPAAKAFFVVMVPSSDLMLDTMSAHELTHALADQHFDLERYLPADGKLDEDAAAARRFVAEGDATLVMLLYTMRTMLGDQLTPPVLAVLHDQIEKLASQDLAALEAQARQQSALFGGMDAEIQKSIDAMDDIPPAVLVPLLDSYMKGALVALTAYERGGWAAVDALYRDPPSSTEQVLHPATKLYPVRDRPRRITLAHSADPELAGNVLGELQWKIYFELWKVPHAAEAAAGWGGDRYSVTRRRDGRLIGRIATVWDTPDDARQFADAYAASLAARFPGAGPLAAGIARPDGGRVFVRVAGDRVFIVDGADDAGALDALVKSTKLD